MSVIDTLVVNRTPEDVRRKNAKGTYNAEDMNRVNSAVEYLRPMFRAFGYMADDVKMKTWIPNELPRLSDADAFLRNVRDLDGRFRYAAEMIVLPETMRMLTYSGANNIEKFLSAMPEVFERMESAWYYAEEVYCGEV